VVSNKYLLKNEDEKELEGEDHDLHYRRLSWEL
jgi:hypothetical protein